MEPAPPPAAPVDSAPCPNCGGALGEGPYCPGCGQAKTPLRQPVHQFVGESLVEYFGVDGRLWRSLGLLLFKPGRLTEAYFAGRRARYLRPLRLYLTATLFFFFLLSVVDPVSKLRTLIEDEAESQIEMTVAERLNGVSARLAEMDSTLTARRARLDALVRRADSTQAAFAADSAAGRLGVSFEDDLAPDDSADVADERREELSKALEDVEDERDGLAGRQERYALEAERLLWIQSRLASFPPDSSIVPADLDEAALYAYPAPSNTDVNIGLPTWMVRNDALGRIETARTDADRIDGIIEYLRGTLSRIPTVMFILLPVFALLLKLIYVRRGWYYSEHLVFALHTHAFAFLVFAVVVLFVGYLDDATWAVWTRRVLLFSVPVYFYVAQKRVYGQGWVKTAVKSLLLAFLYGVLLFSVGLVLALVLAAAFG